MKEKYEKPEVEVIRFEENSDVITASTMTIVVEGGSAEGFEP